MSNDIQVGDRVRLLGLPDWLVHDLPASEQTEMRSFVGQSCEVSEIDAYGYYWLGFGTTVDDTDVAYYSGHSFCVPREFIERDPEVGSHRQMQSG
ncbi:hypothetical protein [Bradyrhizobium sp. STM 3557]|uniref:hypothetical protein n=1 Tax=Bradyrhizobium sp. STM 3557 TaxID=578920 RepID=UPI003890FE10